MKFEVYKHLRGHSENDYDGEVEGLQEVRRIWEDEWNWDRDDNLKMLDGDDILEE